MKGSIVPGSEIGADLEWKADVAVIGSGAGGAVLASELAEGGLRVVLLEEGAYYTRRDYKDLRPLEAFRLLYRDEGMTAALGLPGIPLPLGRCVGGTTVINSGTCFRTPEELLAEWGRELEGVGSEDLLPCFEKVEKIQNIVPVDWTVMGENGLTFRRGTERMGYRGGPLRRNMRRCHGCGRCVFGCPTDAKQAVHLTYVPRFVGFGGTILTHVRAEQLLVEERPRPAPGRRRAGGPSDLGLRAVGVEGALLAADGKTVSHRFRVRAGAVVLAAGAIYSPVFLLRNGLGNRSGQVGKNLRIHPGVRVAALMKERIEGWRGVPQSYYVDEFFQEGIMLEGIAVPPGPGAVALPFFGRRHKEAMARFDHLATFGAMIHDTTRGRVRADRRRRPFITYFMNREDAEKLRRAVLIACDIYRAAGALELYPGVSWAPVVKTTAELETLKRRRMRPSDMEMMAFHPMGTCRMGADPDSSVVDAWTESHDVGGLFVCDGSIFPTSLGVNPQESIMAFATRTARHLLELAGRYLG